MIKQYQTIIGLLIFIFITNFQVKAGNDPTFENQEAWLWYVNPHVVKKGACLVSDTLILLVKNKDVKGTEIFMIGFDEMKNIIKLQAVAFDDSNKRYLLNGGGWSSSNGAWIRSYHLSPQVLPFEKIKYIGIEKLTKENQQSIIIPHAIQKLNEAGNEILSSFDFGKQYHYELTTIKGTKVSSQSLKGKVVLFDFWASWCEPCMKLIPQIKTIYYDLKDKGFEVIGINLDESIEKCREATIQEKLQWPVYIAPTDKDYRELWETIAGIQGIPRLWLIDRNGVMRSDVSSNNLQTEIYKLIDEK